VGIAIPLELVSAEALSFERAHMLASHVIGRLVLLALIVLPLWKGAHHLRHVSIDSGGGDRDAVVAPILYLIATLGSVLGVLAVFRI
jgi:fumarate reductase subunit D